MAIEGTRRGPLTTLCASGLLLSALSSSPAFGQESPVVATAGQSAAASEADKARAAELFKKSAVEYRKGNFSQAIALVDEAYKLDPQPVLLYNRARAAEGLGLLDDAIAGYEKFVAEEPNTPDRGAIEQRLVTLRRQRDERIAVEKERAEREKAGPVEAPPAPPPREGGHSTEQESRLRRVAPWVVAGAGAAGIVLGGTFGLLALSKKDDAVAEPTQRGAMGLKDDADGLATMSTVSFVVGGVLLAAGATWILLDKGVFGGKKPATTAGLTFSGLRGTFQ